MISKKEPKQTIATRVDVGVRDKIISISEKEGVSMSVVVESFILSGMGVYEKPKKVKGKESSVKFVKPALTDIKFYLIDKINDSSEAEPFFNYYESNGWRVGKNPMKSWEAAVSSWISRKKPVNKKGSAPDRTALFAEMSGNQRNSIDGECYESK